jgi:hypothetical protein
MGYILTRRYVIDADTLEQLVELYRSAMLKSGTPDMEIDSLLTEMVPVEVADEVASAFDAGNMTDAVRMLDTYIENDKANVRPYFPKYSLDDIRAWKPKD